MKTTHKLFFALSFSLVLSACKKDETEPHEHDSEETPVATTGNVTVNFANKFKGSDLVLNTTKYTNNTDTFNVTTLNYYISNIKLTATDNSVYSEPESYHLVKASDVASLQFTISNVPAKNYSTISFLIGVDSTRNVSGAQTGALDPANGMFWSWNSGYIMAKLEGTSPQSGATGKMIMHHIGGFSGSNSALKTVTLPFASNVTVTSTSNPKISIDTNLEEWFAPNMVSFSSMHTIHMPGAMAKKIADNYANMFSLNKTQN